MKIRKSSACILPMRRVVTNRQGHLTNTTLNVTDFVMDNNNNVENNSYTTAVWKEEVTRGWFATLTSIVKPVLVPGSAHTALSRPSPWVSAYCLRWLMPRCWLWPRRLLSQRGRGWGRDSRGPGSWKPPTERRSRGRHELRDVRDDELDAPPWSVAAAPSCRESLGSPSTAGRSLHLWTETKRLEECLSILEWGNVIVYSTATVVKPN